MLENLCNTINLLFIQIIQTLQFVEYIFSVGIHLGVSLIIDDALSTFNQYGQSSTRICFNNCINIWCSFLTNVCK